MEKKSMKSQWVVYAVSSLIAYGAMWTLIKYVLTKGMTSEGALFYVFLFAATILGGVIYCTSRSSFSINRVQLFFLIIIAVSSTAGNFLLFKALHLSDNPGYALAIANLNVVVVFIVSLFIFGSHINLTKIAGMIFALIEYEKPPKSHREIPRFLI
jgi:uncharacterized membrane protein